MYTEQEEKGRVQRRVHRRDVLVEEPWGAVQKTYGNTSWLTEPATKARIVAERVAKTYLAEELAKDNAALRRARRDKSRSLQVDASSKTFTKAKKLTQRV